MPFYTNVNGVIKELKALDSYSNGSYKHPYVYKASVNGVTTDLVNLINAENIVDFINIDITSVHLWKTTWTGSQVDSDESITSNKDDYYLLEANNNSYTISILADKNAYVAINADYYVVFNDGHAKRINKSSILKQIFNSFSMSVTYSHYMGNDRASWLMPSVLGMSTPIYDEFNNRKVTNSLITLDESNTSDIVIGECMDFGVYSSSSRSYRTVTFNEFIVNGINIPIKITNNVS